MIYVAGIGIDGKESLSRKVLDLIDQASLLVGSKRFLNLFPEFYEEKMVIGSNLDQLYNTIFERYMAGKDVVILASGDPNFFGIAHTLIKRFGKQHVEIIPNVSLMQEAFARVKESWADAKFISLHGREIDLNVIIMEIIGHKKVGIFTDPENSPSLIAEALLKSSGACGYRVYVFENMGMEDERITEGTCSEISGKDFSPLNVMLLIEEKETYTSGCTIYDHIFGIPDSGFSHYRGMITKEEIRCIVLGKMSLREDSILWDIGAGSGSISIELSRIVRRGRVYAIDKKADAMRLISENKRRFNAFNLVPLLGEAPEVLRDLPKPDSVFIGGSGGRLEEILIYVLQRVSSKGSVVSNFATLENLSRALNLLKGMGYRPEVVEVSIARSETISGRSHFKAINPVFIMRVKKHEK